MIETGLRDRTVLVTGGAGGIGAAISRAFAAEGARVAVHYLAEDAAPPEGGEWAHVTPAVEAAVSLARDLGGVAVAADLADPEGPRRLVAEVAERLGPVDVLVNNAAHCETPDTIDALSAASLERHYRVNAVAPALLIAEVARRRGAEPPCVVNVSTDSARASRGRSDTGPRKQRWRR